MTQEHVEDASTSSLPQTVPDDQAIMLALENGAPEAMVDLTAAYGAEIQRLVYRLLYGSADCDDVLQDVFLAAWRKAHTYRGEGTLLAWLRMLTVNRCRSHLRKRNAFQRMLMRLASRQHESAMSATTLNDERFEPLHNALAQLKPADREVLVLYYLEELDGEQTAAAMGISSSAVHMRLKRARDRLRRILKEVDHDE